MPIKPLLWAIAAVQFVQTAWMVLLPASFYDQIAGFGVRNDHLLRDSAAFNAALAGALVVAVSRPSWRAPVLAFAALQYALHAINHLVDLGDARTTVMGWFDLVSLSLGAAGLAAFAVHVSRQQATA